MKITQIRNATILIEYDAIKILVDPMLAPKGALPALKYFTGSRRRNPIVDLPPQTPALLDGVTHCLITHCQRGHFDHLDTVGKHWLRERQIPVLCMPRDTAYLAARGMSVSPLGTDGKTPFARGHITPIPCLHGRGWIGRFMEHGHGYVITQENEPTLYLAGDTVLTDDVVRCVQAHTPAVIVAPAGGAAMDMGGDLIMDTQEILTLARLSEGITIANHLEALDHCPTRRADLVAAAADRGLSQRLRVPLDGETYCIT